MNGGGRGLLIHRVVQCAGERDLKQRGVQFEEYDVPGFDKETGIAQTGEDRGGWFKDSEGNLLGIIQRR